MKTILITGGAGNIGGSLATALAGSGEYHVVIVDNLSTGSENKLPLAAPRSSWTFVNADANVRETIAPIFSRFKFDAIFHYAAVVGVARTLAHPLEVLQDIDGIRNLLNLAKEYGAGRIYFSSSSEVYGEPVEIPQVEATTPLNSRLPYAVVKNVGEVYMKAYGKEYGLPYTIFRFFNTYGPNQSSDFVISRFITLALSNQPITIYGDGKQTRTFCFIDDNIAATLNSLERGMALDQTINVGSDQEITILDLAKLIIRLLGSSSEIVHLAALPEGDMTRRKPDISLMKTLIDRPLIALEEGIMRTAGALDRQLAGTKMAKTKTGS